MKRISNFENLSSLAFMRPSQPLSAFFIFSEILDTLEGQWYEKMSYLGHIALKTITNCDMAFRISVATALMSNERQTKPTICSMMKQTRDDLRCLKGLQTSQACY